MAGKGSRRRRLKVSRDEFDRNWDAIFPRKNWTHQCDNMLVTISRKDVCPYCGKQYVSDDVQRQDNNI